MTGTGAFLVQNVDSNGTSLPFRNPAYFLKGFPYLDRYEITSGIDNQTQVAAFRSGNQDILPQASLTVQQAEDLKKANPGFQLQMVKGLGSGTELGLKLTQKPFDDIRVRRAIYKAFDPQTVIDTAYSSGWLTVGLTL